MDEQQQTIVEEIQVDEEEAEEGEEVFEEGEEEEQPPKKEEELVDYPVYTALFQFDARSERELSFKVGELIVLLEEPAGMLSLIMVLVIVAPSHCIYPLLPLSF